MKRGSQKLFSSIEIFILIISIIAVSYAIGSEFQIVSSVDTIDWGEIPKGASITDGALDLWTYSDNKWVRDDKVSITNEAMKKAYEKTNSGFQYSSSQIPSETPAPATTPETSSVTLPAKTDYTIAYKRIDGKAGTLIRNNKQWSIDGVNVDIDETGKITSTDEGKTDWGNFNDFETTFGTDVKNVWHAENNVKFMDAFAFAGIVTGIVHLYTSSQGWSSQQSLALDAAISTGTLAYYGLGKLGANKDWSTVGTLIIAAIVFYSMYEETKSYTYTFTCNPWTAPSGGENCELCNSQEFPCSEYQCMSLGEACELINVGTGEEKCTWKDPYDSSPPIISTFDDALLNEKYEYTPDSAISPPNRGVEVKYTETRDGCVPAFTPFSFGIQLDEPAKCRIDYARKQTYDEMSYNFGGSPLFKYNHTNIMSLPSPSSLENENITLENGGIFNIYVKCQDPNGNYNVNDFVFRFCVDDSPDTTPPIIEVTNPTNNAPIRNNQTEIETTIYLNEPSTCKWSHSSQKYDQMTNQMTCATSAIQMNAQMLYECKATLDGTMDNQDNKFYFACKDKPNTNEDDRNENQVYEYTLIGTSPLYIDSVTPNETTISNASEAVRTTIKVKTEQGYNDGESKCYFSNAEDSGFIEFAETSSYEHIQDLWLAEGTYTYYIKCVDAGGNVDEETINFDVDSDTEEPFVARALKLGEQLVIITNEPGRCVYSSIDCKYQFDDGTNFISNGDGMEHYVTWESDKTYYVKCKDDFENYPAGDECNLIIKPLIRK